MDSKTKELYSKEMIDEHPIYDKNGDEKKLFEAIRQDKLIVFYGAGVSMLAGCASWTDLAIKIVKKIPNNRLSILQKTILSDIATFDPKKCITICYSIMKTDSDELNKCYYAPIQESLSPINSDNFIEIHNLLYDLQAKSYVTTNIDKGIERISDKIELGKKKKIDLTNPKLEDEFDFSGEFDFSNYIRDGNFFYLHGTKDENIHNSIFTANNYFDFYKRGYVNKFLHTIFKGEYTVLFIGYSFNDYEILQNIFLALDKENPYTYNHYLLSPIYSKDYAKFEIEREYFKLFSIKALPYFKDYVGYEKLFDVLNRLIKDVNDLKSKMEDYIKDVDKIVK